MSDALQAGAPLDPSARLELRSAQPAWRRTAEPRPASATLLDRAGATPIRRSTCACLVWRSALPISATQDFFPHRARAWFRGTPVRFELDDTVPLGACHHQKIVVIDDAPGLRRRRRLRLRPLGHRRPPRRRPAPHAATGGRARAAARGDGDGRRADRRGVRRAVPRPLARGRRRAAAPPPADVPATTCGRRASRRISTGARLGRRAHRAGLARRGRRSREIAALTLEAIAAAKSLIYLENQYFTWPLAVEALAARLAEPDGPGGGAGLHRQEPQLLRPHHHGPRPLHRAVAAEVERRVRPLPRAGALSPRDGRPIIAHAKVMVVDDWLARDQLGQPQQPLARLRHRVRAGHRGRRAGRPRRARRVARWPRGALGRPPGGGDGRAARA